MRGLRRPLVAATLPVVLTLAAECASGEEAGTPRDGGPGGYRVAQWTTQEGLPQNTVTDMVFLPNGELWLATFGGLARFDGYRFRVLDMAADEGLPANRIVALAAEGPDSFLFLTQQGHLGRVEAGRSASLVPPAVPSVDALGLLIDRSGAVFCQLGDGSLWQTDGRLPWRRVLAAAGAPGARHSLTRDEEGAAWAVWGDRIVRLTGGQPGAQVPLPERESTLFARPGGGFWVGLQGGVGTVADDRLVRLEIRPRLDDRVFTIEPDGARGLWLATQGRLSRLDQAKDGSWQTTPLPLPLPPATAIRSLRLDREGALWVGSAGAGLLRVHRPPTRLIGAASGLADIGALAPDGDGGAFVSSGCRALFHVDREGSVRPAPLPAVPPGDPLVPCGISLASGPRGTVWARAGNRLLRLAAGGAQVVSSDLPADEGPIVANPDGSIWVVSRSGGVRLLSPRGKSLRDLLRLSAPLVSATLDPDGALWVGGDGEVLRVREETTDRIGRAAGVPRGLVRDVLADSPDTAWIGTYGGGVGRLRGGRVTRLTVAQGLPDNSISRILDDGRGRLWISTNRGVAVVEKAQAEAVAEGRERAPAPVVLAAERGVPEANFGSPAGFADAAGRLWFGTIEGAVALDAAAFPFNRTPPAVRIEEVRADERTLPLGPVVAVPARSARVRVRYASPSLLYPDELRFRFRVEGIDAAWVDAGRQRTVDWSPPGPGRYLFAVAARNEDGVWSTAPAQLVLDVRPAWWQTTAFRASVVLVLALLLAGGVRWRIRAIERRHAERLRALEEQRQAEQRLLAMRAQVEDVSRAALAGELSSSLAHEVRQPVAAIVNNAEAGRRNLARYLDEPQQLRQLFDDIVAGGMRVSEAVRDVRGVLGSREVEPAALDLSELVREMLPLLDRELEENRVEVEIALAPALPPVEGLRAQLGQVVVNLIANACEALAGVAGPRRITVSTAERGGRVELAVGDNGPGLADGVKAQLFEPFVTTKPGGLGMGLAICRSIAERHGGHLTAESPAGGGVRMTLTLPAVVPAAARA